MRKTLDITETKEGCDVILSIIMISSAAILLLHAFIFLFFIWNWVLSFQVI